jgi:LmbE family N-acetylglucosaminyl deacetylase
MKLRNTCIHILVTCFLCLCVQAQIKPIYDQGALGLGRLLKRLNTSASVMMIGAHPDDEDTALLAYLARGENARTAYLSLTRGDGGQNIIGPELGEALGVIRTEELLQARKLDGAEQFFTRAYDYGFSKTLAEARQKWDEKVILCDSVRAIRLFRPLVVIAQFNGTPADGHGQHQYSGYIAPLAVKAAADIGQCVDAGPTWQVKKFYVRHRGTNEPTLRINTGKYDPMLGRSYFEIAMEARSQHRSQEQGVLELKGEAFSALDLAGSEAKEKGIFESLDISVRGIAANTGENSSRFIDLAEKVQQAAVRALEQYNVGEPTKMIPLLVEGYSGAYDAEWSIRSPGPKAFMVQKQSEFLAALRIAAGIQLDAISDRETVVPGESFSVSARVFYPANDLIKVEGITIKTPLGWSVTNAESPTQSQSQFRREVPNFGSTFTVKVAADASPTQPYWLREPRQGDLFDWAAGPERTLPLQEPEATAEIKISISGKEFTFTQPLEYRYADDVRGEIRRPLVIVPLASVSLDQDLMIVARSAKEIRKNLAVTVTNNSSSPISGKVGMTLPNGWSASAGDVDFSLAKKGESTSVQFSVKIPANPAAGSFSVPALAVVGNTAHSRTMRTLAYPHIQTHRIYGEAAAKTNVIDLKTSPARIGYLPGSGDRVPQAIAQMGLTVETIDERTLASGDLSQFDVIVVGIRAYQVRTDIVAHNKRLLDFANSGGTLIVQYQLPAYTQQNLAPFAAQQGPRVSDELAKVTMLDAAHPILSTPNRITDADFEGWVQERNLYNFSTMDAKYTGLLESHDANEAENKGGLVVADVGKGKYIYCSYSLFRQLPAGVPGAYRLLANMLAYSGNNSRSLRK